MTEGDRLTGDTPCYQASPLGRVPEVRVGQLVAERSQVRDVGGKLTNGVAQALVEVGRRALVAFRLDST